MKEAVRLDSPRGTFVEPHTMMSRFGVQNYKCLKDVDIPLTPMHVLIGQNDAGKTSLLEAMYALFRTRHFELVDAFSGVWQGRELVYSGSADSTIEFATEFRCQPEQDSPSTKYKLLLEFGETNQQCQVRGEWCGSLEHLEAIGRNSHLDKTATLMMSDLQLVRHLSLNDFVRSQLNKLADEMSSVQMYSFKPSLMALPAAFSDESKLQMHSDGFGLPTLLDEIIGFDPNLFLQIRRRFCQAFPQYKTLRLEKESGIVREHRDGRPPSFRGTAIGKAIYFETNDGASIPARGVSDGAILYLGFLAIAYLPTPSKLLLIEEPETGIYPERLEQVIELLRRFTEGDDAERLPQIVMTTHSPYMLSLFEPEEVTFLSREDDHVRARPMRDAPHIRERLGGGEFYLGELWYNLSEAELFADG